MTGRHVGLGLAVVAAIFVGCEGAELAKPPPGDTVPSPYKDLTEREHVLQNIETAYNQRNITEYQKLLDDNFIFFFSDGDVGGEIPEQWDRASEMNATRNMLDPNFKGPNPILSIDLSLSMENLEWEPQTARAAIDDTLYTTTVTYDYTIQAAPDITFIVTNNPKAQYTIREIDVNGVKYWRLVQWRDLAITGAFVYSIRAGTLSIEEESWGRVKALYGG